MDPPASDNGQKHEEGPTSTASTAEQPEVAQIQATSPAEASSLTAQAASLPVQATSSSVQTAPPSVQTAPPTVQDALSPTQTTLPPAQAQVQVHPPAQTDIPPTPPRKSPTSDVRPQLSVSVPRHARSRDRMMEEDAYSISRDFGNARNGNTVQPPSGGFGDEIRPPGRTRTVDTLHSARQPPGRARTLDTLRSGEPTSRLDWIVPIEEKSIPKLSVGERLQPTLTRAHLERDKYAIKAKMTGYALNAAIGMQVLLGSLTTGLSAAAATGRQVGIATTVLGGLSTLVASYLARARGSNEPELSITRVKDLEQFIRECDAFQMDHGHVTTNEQDEELFKFRRHFEELLGNASGERKLSPPV